MDSCPTPQENPLSRPNLAMTHLKANERLAALKALQLLLDKKQPLTLSRLSNLSKELCLGVCRYYFFLAHMTQRWIKKPQKDTQIWLCVLLGLYQLHFLRVPEYAAVKETVDLLYLIKKSWAKGFVNAILRNYCREKDMQIFDSETNHPEWLLQKIKLAWPEHWQAILAANDQHPPMTLRVNQTQVTRDDYLKTLRQAGIEAEIFNETSQGIILKKPCAVELLPYFLTGVASVQDGAAQLSAGLLDLHPGLRVLDACCAPGGKTGHILEEAPQLAECVALDIDQKRYTRVQENLTRLNITATQIIGDALEPHLWWDGKLFDRILLDAPCSATGVIRRHPDIKLLRKAEDIQTITIVQKKMLNALWDLLSPGGRLVYVTCSILPEENQAQIAQFQETHSNCEVLPRPLPLGHWTGHGVQIFPGEHHMDGFFYSVLMKQ